ncbi:DUF4924 family protein [Belliella kenyensis]|uniref:DUF4924 family protein n=1 Tax=Belliella kenyensis TaxID=1472724 RepID=A0ABV8EP46_9BACT|nr:DUF4924 family protein [Belliella kenyensis]MCH7403649.1 DUF4924 family protein [Belliella kenyensis]MDN3602197.1 DUF4924 family protein [Belliella kenyensis]
MKAIAEKKLNTNLPEYIIYMYQMEDLIRVYDFNLADIKQYVIAHYPITEEEKSATEQWFLHLSEMMKAENITITGHLRMIQKHVEQLAMTHWKLLKEDSTYYKIYHNAKPHIIQMIMDANGEDIGHEIQICINGVYGFLLAKLRSREIPKGYDKAIEAFGDVLSYLNLSIKEKLT